MVLFVVVFANIPMLAYSLVLECRNIVSICFGVVFYGRIAALLRCYAAACFAKGGKSGCKRPSFTVQKVAFRTVKGHLLQSRWQLAGCQCVTNGIAARRPHWHYAP